MEGKGREGVKRGGRGEGGGGRGEEGIDVRREERNRVEKRWEEERRKGGGGLSVCDAGPKKM